jgi:hypothetical protein
MRTAAILSACIVSAIGCGKKAAVEPLVQWGVVDQSLSPEQRAQQDALARLFKTLQSGTAVRHVKSYEPDLDFQESTEAFIEQGIQLRSWDWAGPPDQDKLRVHMIFLLDEPPGDKTVVYDRAYSVNRIGNRFVIRRAD